MKLKIKKNDLENIAQLKDQQARMETRTRKRIDEPGREYQSGDGSPLKQSEELATFLMWKEDDETKVLLLRNTEIELSSLNTMVGVKLRKVSNKLKV